MIKCYFNSIQSDGSPTTIFNDDNNPRLVDDSSYIPLDKQIKRMIADGVRLEEFKSTEQYKALYDFSDDDSIVVDDTLYMDKTELRDYAKDLSKQIEELQSKINVKPVDSSATVKKDVIPDSVQSSDSSGDNLATQQEVKE